MCKLKDLYKNDGALLDFYEVNLLIPGWAGQVDGVEAGYIAEKLKTDRKLYLKWRKELRKLGYRKMMRSPSTEAIKKWVYQLRSIDIGNCGAKK